MNLGIFGLYIIAIMIILIIYKIASYLQALILMLEEFKTNSEEYYNEKLERLTNDNNTIKEHDPLGELQKNAMKKMEMSQNKAKKGEE
jgi:Sec-independent protein translocase protein TatA